MVYFLLNFYKNKWIVWDFKGTTSSLCMGYNVTCQMGLNTIT
jgi:hypothetical protein